MADEDEHHQDRDHAAHVHEHEHHEHQHRHAPYTEQDYVAAVVAYRADKDAFFKDAPGSPIPADQREAFDGLPYYPVDPSLNLENLAFEPYSGSEPETFQIPTSDGQLRPARRAGTLAFELDGETLKLTGYALDSRHTHSIFVPFLDATSGRETYGAGRYLDLAPEEDGTYRLDFNLAYHPSCVYDSKFSCPLTPAENRLPVRIEAGERLPTDNDHVASTATG
jgi:uncharacterized protein